MAAGGVNQRCSSQNTTPPSAGLTAALPVLLNRVDHCPGSAGAGALQSLASAPPTTKKKEGELFAFLLQAQTKPATLLRLGPAAPTCVWSPLLFPTF